MQCAAAWPGLVGGREVNKYVDTAKKYGVVSATLRALDKASLISREWNDVHSKRPRPPGILVPLSVGDWLLQEDRGVHCDDARDRRGRAVGEPEYARLGAPLVGRGQPASGSRCRGGRDEQRVLVALAIQAVRYRVEGAR